jgi:hypothetical protein
MKRSWLFAVVALNLVALLALVFIFPRPMISPGPLAPGHEAIANDCFACHAPFRGAAADRCQGCHALATIGITTTKGAPLKTPTPRAAFHQQMVTNDCMACHVLHRGRAVGTTDRRPFSHDLLRPESRSQCQTCHAAPDTAVHRGLRLGCAQCHSTRSWEGAAFDHGRMFALTGPHATDCATCHAASDYSRYTCFGCHEHQPDAIRARHRREGIGAIENCVGCHRGGGRERGEGGGGDDQD